MKSRLPAVHLGRKAITIAASEGAEWFHLCQGDNTNNCCPDSNTQNRQTCLNTLRASASPAPSVAPSPVFAQTPVCETGETSTNCCSRLHPPQTSDTCNNNNTQKQGRHTCAILDNSKIKCWGQNTYGQLGLGHTNHIGDGSGEMTNLATVNLGTNLTAYAIALGSHHTCAILKENKAMKCWGYNDKGQLGYDNTVNIGHNAQKMVANQPPVGGQNFKVKAITAGHKHTCAVLTGGSDEGKVKCWGSNEYGQLGLTAGKDSSNVNIGDATGEFANISPVMLNKKSCGCHSRGLPYLCNF